MANKERVVVVTGAASGVGRETSRLFAQNNYTVICTDLNEAELQRTVEAVRKEGGIAQGRKADLCDVKQVGQLADYVEKELGRLDVLLNIAGGLIDVGQLADQSDATSEKILDLNLRTVYRTCKAFIPLLKKSRGGTIVNIASQGGKLGQAGVSIYNAAKAAVISLSNSLGLELRQDGIRVSVINPGTINTAFHDGKGFTEDFKKLFLDPTEIAQACLFVANRSSNALVIQLDIVPMAERVECKIY